MKTNKNMKNRIENFASFNAKRLNESTQETGGRDAFISIKGICEYAEKLKAMVTETTEVENWIIQKLAVCREHLDDIYHYMDSMTELSGTPSTPSTSEPMDIGGDNSFELGAPAEPTVFDGGEIDDDFPDFDTYASGDFSDKETEYTEEDEKEEPAEEDGGDDSEDKE